MSVSVNKEQNEYIVIAINNETGKTVEFEFLYNEEAEEKILLIDIQETSQPIPLVKPKEPVYETIEITTEPEILNTIKKLNSTSSVLRESVSQILEVQKSSSNLVNEYRVTIGTKTEEKAILIVDKNPETDEITVIDVIKYVELPEVLPPVEICETINPVTQVVETTYPTEETFMLDESYEQIKEYLREDTKTHQITSIVKEKYGSNDEYNILLKSDTLSPQQIELNINKFNKEITILQNKTVVSREIEEKSPF